MSTFLIFSDDWGRHPSSAQHLTRCLLRSGKHRIYWVNTIGTRPPGFNLLTLRRGFEKICSWIFSRKKPKKLTEQTEEPEPAPTILQPVMFPWFRTRFDRWLNKFLLSRQINRVLAKHGESKVTVITTLPIVADLPGTLPAVTRWVYYCVDDWSCWPGMDSRPLAEMEVKLVQEVTRIVTAGENLRDRIHKMGRESLLLTHGVDLNFWKGENLPEKPEFTSNMLHPIYTFWGLIDERLELEMLERLSLEDPQSTILIAGPTAAPEVARRLEQLKNVRLLGPIPYEKLPVLAAESDVLLMPYRKDESTEQIQPLKMTEYLASGKPAVVRALRASTPWSDALDEVNTAECFTALVRLRAMEGLPKSQLQARNRLVHETWEEKAKIFEEYIVGISENTNEITINHD